MPDNAADYHSDKFSKTPSLSSSVAWEIEPSNPKAGSPKHGWLIHPKLGNQGKEQTDAMRFGSICHSMLLGKGSAYRVAPVFKTKAGKDSSSWATTEAQDFKADCEASGVIPILKSEESAAQECVVEWARQLKDFGLNYLFDNQQHEKTIYWKENYISPQDGVDNADVDCRAMIDIVTEDFREIWDIKTMSRAHPKKCLSKVLDEGLPLRSEFYKRGVEKFCLSRGSDVRGKVKHGYIFCSTEKPFAVVPVYELDAKFQMIGKNQVERSIQTWGECLRTNKWPMFSAVKRLECPTWAFKDEILEDETE